MMLGILRGGIVHGERPLGGYDARRQRHGCAREKASPLQCPASQGARAVSQLLWTDRDREVWFSLGENHEMAYRFGLHQLRNCLTMTYCKQALPTRFAHPQPLPSFQNDRPFALSFAENLTHLLYIDNDRAMDAHEFSRVQCTG